MNLSFGCVLKYASLSMTLILTKLVAQDTALFKHISFKSLGVNLYQLFPAKEGAVWITSSAGLWRIKGSEITGPVVSDGRLYDEKGKLILSSRPMRDFMAEDSIRAIAQGPDGIFYFVTHDNIFIWRRNGIENGYGFPPFNFPKTSPVVKIWIDGKGDIYAGTRSDNFFIVEEAGKNISWEKIRFGKDNDSNNIIKEGAKTVKKIDLIKRSGIFAFAQDSTDINIVWVGSSAGLYKYYKNTGKCELIVNEKVCITEIITLKNGNVWFSTLEKGMGVYNSRNKRYHFYQYDKENTGTELLYPIKTFCLKSQGQFWVAVQDSTPAIFNTDNQKFFFINHKELAQSENSTLDVKLDVSGNFLFIKGGDLYKGNNREGILESEIVKGTSIQGPFIKSISLEDRTILATLNYKADLLKSITLDYDQNSLLVEFDQNDFNEKDSTQYAWKIDGVTNGWRTIPKVKFDSSNFCLINNLSPGEYTLQIKLRVGSQDWRKQIAELKIKIEPPFWYSFWFWFLVMISLVTLVFLLYRVRIQALKKQVAQKTAFKKDLVEYEAKALRAQMNPHFIFNCLNSIKYLIQQNDTEKAVSYLAVFSKLIRTLLNNADKKEITLFDEIETCKLYLQLEAMRLEGRFSYKINIDEKVDMKSIKIPALIIQPFIENAIWHGIMPKGSKGTIELRIAEKGNDIEVIIEDDGIGMESSKNNKTGLDISHESKGLSLTEARLKLDNFLRQRNAKLDISEVKDNAGIPLGTRIVLTINKEL